jgi:hypothetical protein
MKGNKGKSVEGPKVTSAPNLNGLGKIGNGDYVVVTKIGENKVEFTKYVSKDTNAVAALLALLLNVSVTFLDWGGVFGLSKAGTTLKKFDGEYWLFSFTTPKKIGSELDAMATRFFAAGGTGLIILTQKKGKQGKAALMNAIVPHLKQNSWYYEDSVRDVIDELVVANNLKVHWVQPQPPTEADIQEAAEQGEAVEDYSQVFPKSQEVERITQEGFLENLFE